MKLQRLILASALLLAVYADGEIENANTIIETVADTDANVERIKKSAGNEV